MKAPGLRRRLPEQAVARVYARGAHMTTTIRTSLQFNRRIVSPGLWNACDATSRPTSSATPSTLPPPRTCGRQKGAPPLAPVWMPWGERAPHRPCKRLWTDVMQRLDGHAPRFTYDRDHRQNNKGAHRHRRGRRRRRRRASAGLDVGVGDDASDNNIAWRCFCCWFHATRDIIVFSFIDHACHRSRLQGQLFNTLI